MLHVPFRCCSADLSKDAAELKKQNERLQALVACKSATPRAMRAEVQRRVAALVGSNKRRCASLVDAAVANSVKAADALKNWKAKYRRLAYRNRTTGASKRTAQNALRSLKTVSAQDAKMISAHESTISHLRDDVKYKVHGRFLFCCCLASSKLNGRRIGYCRHWFEIERTSIQILQALV